MILPQMVPVQSPCQSRRRRFASSYRVAERTAGGEWDVGYTLNVTKLYWSRSGIMHVAIAWDHKPLLLLATALLPNRITASFESEAGPPYDKQRIQMGLRSGNTVLISFRSGVGHFQCVLIALSADLHTNNGKGSTSFGNMYRHFVPTSRGYLNGWRVPTAVLLWTSALKFLMGRCTIYRGEMKMKSTPLYFRISTTLEIPKVPRS